jgi:hypothetical protein
MPSPGALERSRVNPRQLALDVSDAALVEVYGAAWRSVVALRELGVWIVLDRLGTTFSSLAHLEQLPIDAVRLDRSCVAGLPDDPRDRAGLHRRPRVPVRRAAGRARSHQAAALEGRASQPGSILTNLLRGSGVVCGLGAVDPVRGDETVRASADLLAGDGGR